MVENNSKYNNYHEEHLVYYVVRISSKTITTLHIVWKKERKYILRYTENAMFITYISYLAIELTIRKYGSWRFRNPWFNYSEGSLPTWERLRTTSLLQDTEWYPNAQFNTPGKWASPGARTQRALGTALVDRSSLPDKTHFQILFLLLPCRPTSADSVEIIYSATSIILYNIYLYRHYKLQQSAWRVSLP